MCKLRWNENPVGIMRRVHSNGGMCDFCKDRVNTGHEAVMRSSLFTFSNPNKRAKLQSSDIKFVRISNIITEVVTCEPLLDNAVSFHQLNAEQQNKRREDHENEILERVKWCLDRNLVPAHDWLHLSCGNDSKFMFGISPWLADGSVNPDGVPYARRSDCFLKKELQICEHDERLQKQSTDKKLEKVDVRCQKLRKAAVGSRKIDTYAVT